MASFSCCRTEQSDCKPCAWASSCILHSCPMFWLELAVGLEFKMVTLQAASPRALAQWVLVLFWRHCFVGISSERCWYCLEEVLKTTVQIRGEESLPSWMTKCYINSKLFQITLKPESALSRGIQHTKESCFHLLWADISSKVVDYMDRMSDFLPLWWPGNQRDNLMHAL